jgi:hypothetical protein
MERFLLWFLATNIEGDPPMTDMEMMLEFAQEHNAQGLVNHQRTLQSWISAGVLTPKEIDEARRVLRILREREKSKAA